MIIQSKIVVKIIKTFKKTKLDLNQVNFFQSIVLYNQDKEKIKQERRKKICQEN